MNNVSWVKELPRDIQLHIISFLDIDSRILLGVYNRISSSQIADFASQYAKIPKIVHAKFDDNYEACVDLGLYQMVRLYLQDQRVLYYLIEDKDRLIYFQSHAYNIYTSIHTIQRAIELPYLYFFN